MLLLPQYVPNFSSSSSQSVIVKLDICEYDFKTRVKNYRDLFFFLFLFRETVFTCFCRETTACLPCLSVFKGFSEEMSTGVGL